MEGSNPITMTEWLSPYIWPTHQNGYWSQQLCLTWKEPILSPWQNGSALTSDHGRNQSSHHVIRAHHGHITSSWEEYQPGEHQASPWVLKLHPSQWLCQHINYLFVHRNILELHCSPLHHIPDIVILDLDMIRLVMEPWVLDNFTQLWFSQCI